jgi:hypothetical protein
MDSLLFLAHGSAEVKQQTLFSICSALFAEGANVGSRADFKIVVYTDDVTYFSKFLGEVSFIEYRTINAEQVRIWKGRDDFIHRVKLEVLKNHFEKESGRLIYCDGDTLFLSSVGDLFSKISDATSLMHCREGRIGDDYNSICKKLRKFLKKRKWKLRGEEVEINESTEMWNAGVIGISNSQASNIDLMIELTDQLFGSYEKHVMEQLSVSYLLQTYSNIVDTKKEVFHYYLSKRRMNERGNELLRRYDSFSKLESAWKGELDDLVKVLGEPDDKKRKKWLGIF